MLHTESILIIGGGTFGTSTAYHLARRGYQNIVVLDRWAHPAKESAGHDVNKAVRTEYLDPLYTGLAHEAAASWKNKNGIFSNFYHETGWILAAPDSLTYYIDGTIASQKKKGLPVLEHRTPEQIHKQWPSLNGSFETWNSYWNPNAAWVNARGALQSMTESAMSMGVKYISGEAGHVTRLLFDERLCCVGARCADGTARFADQVVLANGAAASEVLDLKGQIEAMAHIVCHIQLSTEEAEKYKNMPIMCHLSGGMLFPPNHENILKATANYFFTNYANYHPDISKPRYTTDNPQDGIPKRADKHLRDWLRTFVPDIAERPWSEEKFCWDGNTPDFDFLISPSPEHGNLKIAVGGSTHGFKFMPTIGKYIADMMEGKLEPELARRWAWRPGTPSKGTPYPFLIEDFKNLPGWQPGRASKL